MIDDDIGKLMEINRQADKALAVTVQLGYEQVLELVIIDLVKKRQSCVNRGDTEWVPVFDKILSYYITPSEFEQLIANI